MTPLVRCLQTCTTGAALFAVIGACGLTPLSRGPRVRPRPHAPAREVTIRSLTGEWVAVRETPAGRQAITLSLVQTGSTVGGTLRVGNVTVDSDPAQPGHLGREGAFTLGFGHSDERIFVEARPGVDDDVLFASLRGVPADVADVRGRDPRPVALVFTRP